VGAEHPLGEVIVDAQLAMLGQRHSTTQFDCAWAIAWPIRLSGSVRRPWSVSHLRKAVSSRTVSV
jgi:hypothetical protein